jgi:uncharacterized protein DUF3616
VTIQRFQAACDASAATRIAGTTCFVTASDEDYLLRVYDLTRAGPPIGQTDVTAFLKPANTKKEPDIEGSAQIGDRIYWIGSHGRDKDGLVQESRQRLFATENAVTAGIPVLRPIGGPYTQLLADLSRAPDLTGFDLAAASTVAPEDAGGLNIEGLASTADGHLLIGFRNPIPRGRALVVRLDNPCEIVGGTGRARVALHALLDLGGRGIRALEPAGNGGYYVLAGSFDDTKNFALSLWNGVGETPTLLLDGGSLNALNPEELIVAASSPGTLDCHLFSDDGDAMVGEQKCKRVEAAARSFRVTTVQLTV